MAKDHRRTDAELAQGTLLDDPGFLREIVERVLQEVLEAEIPSMIWRFPAAHRRSFFGHARRESFFGVAAGVGENLPQEPRGEVPAVPGPHPLDVVTLDELARYRLDPASDGDQPPRPRVALALDACLLGRDQAHPVAPPEILREEGA